MGLKVVLVSPARIKERQKALQDLVKKLDAAGFVVDEACSAPRRLGAVKSALKRLAKSYSGVLLVFGACRSGPRDVVPEAIRAASLREIEGLGQFVRELFGSDPFLRTRAGFAGSCLILGLPEPEEVSEAVLRRIIEVVRREMPELV